ncbi:MAG: hypothetical protein KDC92_00675 [Bacteroidetes bacterium]|nr:hypothetical protein [Bacteroidota bacterium]
MTRIEKLDAVLKHMTVNPQSEHSKTICENANLDIEADEANRILKKLNTDKYVDMTENQWCYEINYNGIIFSESGGYNGQISEIKSKRTYQSLLNIIVALGTFCAGIYGLLETIKFIVESISC